MFPVGGLEGGGGGSGSGGGGGLGNQAGREPQVCRCGFFSFPPGHTRTFPLRLPASLGFKQGPIRMQMQVWFQGSTGQVRPINRTSANSSRVLLQSATSSV